MTGCTSTSIGNLPWPTSSIHAMAAATPTTSSQDVIGSSISSSQASAYLLQLISQQLKQTGFDGVEAGALSEVLRLTERYTQTLYQRAASLAANSSRHSANAHDVFEAYHSLSALQPRKPAVDATEEATQAKADGLTDPVRGLFKTAKREKRARKKGRISSKVIGLSFITPPPSPPSPPQLTLSDSDTMSEEEEDEWEEVPVGGSNGAEKKNKSKKRSGSRVDPTYLFDGAPRLPPKHSYRRKATVPDTDGLAPHNQTLSSTLLNFIKATAVERGDIPSELGLVDYRRAGEADTTTKRRWTVRTEPDEDGMEM